ncbi:hypothetical protein C8R42DRAFT_723532 [Lentinula raphanica]|nr:hypothetical protein C8R42DRAFT_723532 [Lentinula raphanica]
MPHPMNLRRRNIVAPLVADPENDVNCGSNPTSMLYQDAAGASLIPPRPLTAESDAATTFQFDVQRFESVSDAVNAEQSKVLELLKEKEAVLQGLRLISFQKPDLSKIWRRPKEFMNVAIQAGVESIAAELLVAPPPTQFLEWYHRKLVLCYNV